MILHYDVPLALLLYFYFITFCYSTPTNRSMEGFTLSVNEQQMQTIESYMDLNEDPCDNYYAYACGKWTKQHAKEQYTETTSLIDHRVNQRLIDYFQDYQLQSGADVNGNETATDKIWRYYRACRHAEELQLQRYMQLVRPDAQLDWPLMLEMSAPNATWADEHFNWLLTLAKLRRYNFHGALIDHIVVPRKENASVYVIDLDKPKMEGDHRLPDKVTIAVLLMRLGATKKRAILVAKQLHEFERELQKLHAIEDGYGLLGVTLRELQVYMPQAPWRQYLQHALGYEVDLDFKVQISNLSYFVTLFEFLKLVRRKLVCNYIMFKFLHFLVQDAASSFTKHDCMWDVRTKMDVAINFLYKEEFYGVAAAQYAAEVERVFTHAKQEFAAKLNTNEMQFKPTQLSFLNRKLKAMRFNIGNLPANADMHFVNSYYGNVHISLKDYNKNHLQLLQLRAQKEHAQLVVPAPSAADYFYIADSDTSRSCSLYYLFRQNLIIIPYAILQPPMFHINMHDILKMGLFGFVLAHEIAHAFDVSGLSYDYAGNEQELGKTIANNANFASSLKCLLQHETASIDERVADVVGLRIAYNALFGVNSSMKAHQPNFTAIPVKRLFFLSLAQFFCGNLQAEFAAHDADNLRLQQTLLNFKPFAEEYQCAQGSKMNPEGKCQLY